MDTVSVGIDPLEQIDDAAVVGADVVQGRAGDDVAPQGGDSPAELVKGVRARVFDCY